jgi:hypothetical protein
MARRLKHEQAEAGRRAVEAAIRELGWSMSIEKALADRFGVTPRAIRQWKHDVVKRVQDSIDHMDRRQARADLLSELHGHRAAARKAGKYGAVAAMLNLEARMRGIELAPDEEQPDSLEMTDRSALLRELAGDLSDADLEDLLRLRKESRG